jgi:hypothetical protein
VKLVPSKAARQSLDALRENLEKAQIHGVLRRLAEEDETLDRWEASGSEGVMYCLAGEGASWKITYHIVELDEPVISVVSIKKRRTTPFALRFYPRKNDDE